MTVKDTMVKGVKDFRSTIEVIAAIIGSMVYLNHFVDSRITSKEEFSVAITEVRIAQVESEIRDYQRLGLDNLSDVDKHIYELLLKQQEKLNEKRDSLLGL